MRSVNLDDFYQLSGWSAVASGEARLHLRPDTAPSGAAMRLDFDFADSGGFVVAHRPIQLQLPSSFVISMAVRARAPANAFELKLLDPSGESVWRYRDEGFDFSSEWRELRISSRQIDFAWGPAGGGAPGAIGALEIAVTAGPGGRGSLWLADLRLEDRTPSEPPSVRASSVGGEHPPSSILDGRADSAWSPRRLPAWIEVDFHCVCDYGGLVLHWLSPKPRQLKLLASADGDVWTCLYDAPKSAGLRSHLYLPNGCSRLLRVVLDGQADDPPPGLASLELQPEGFARTIEDFFHHVASAAPRGCYPRWLYREQTYWTPVDIPEGKAPALLNEEGMVELSHAGCSVEPLLSVDGELVTWADCRLDQGLFQPPLPIPESLWSLDDLSLRMTAFAQGPVERS